MKNSDLITKHRKKLENLIEDGASYEEILKQSQVLDEYIIKEMKKCNNS